MRRNYLLTKTKMSELVGWSESNGRRWVKNFKEFLPTETKLNKVMYNMESLRIMKFLKSLNEEGFSVTEIKTILSTEGLPTNIPMLEELEGQVKKQF
jgi:restriction system protein